VWLPVSLAYMSPGSLTLSKVLLPSVRRRFRFLFSSVKALSAASVAVLAASVAVFAVSTAYA
jgi:hypothetical protein